MKKLVSPVINDFLKHRYLYLVLFSVILTMILTLPASMKGADGRRYLRWTHSFVFDQDLHLLNNFEATGGNYQLTPNGYIFELANIGVPLMWMPFYGISSLFLPDAAANNLPPATDPVQLVWLNASSWLYPLLAGILIFGGLRRLFSTRIIITAMASILLGTPVLFYMMTYPLSVHPALIFLASLLFYLWMKQPHKSPRQFPHYLTIGIVTGWLMMIASYNIVYFLLPGFDLLRELISHRNWRWVLLNGLAVSFGGLLGFAPQMIVWGFLFGSPLYSPYGGQLFWTEPYLRETLFSTFHGLFFYAPTLLLVIPGLWWGSKKDRWRTLGLGLVWLALAYIVSINIAWWAGASFGNRYFLTLTPFFVLGLAQFIQRFPKWAWLLITPAVLWTVGLYLQFLSGVGFTSDSIVFSAAELARGQLTAFANIVNILPTLTANSPWALTPSLTLPVIILTAGLTGRLLYGWVTTRAQPACGSAYFFTILSLLIIGFISMAGLRGEQTKANLTAQGFFDQPHQTVMREVKEVAGKAGLVTRAMYHRQTGQPVKAIADLQLASQLWKADNAERPSRLYLGPKEIAKDTVLNLHLDYSEVNVRLVGYQIFEARQQFITGELFWEKSGPEKTKGTVAPIIRAFDQRGNLRGTTTVEFPFPAEYIPPGDIFKDTFLIQLDAPPDAWLWLDVSVADNSTLPADAQGKPATGFFTAARTDNPLTTRSDFDWLCSPLPAKQETQPTICTLLQADVPHRYRPSKPRNPRETPLTEAITLMGYDLSIIPAADSMTARLVLHWHTQNSVNTDYNITVHLLNTAGQPVITQISQPVNNTRPTSTWLVGEWILDEHILQVPPLPPGRYQLVLALTDPSTDAPVQIKPNQIHLILQDVQIP